MQYYIFKEACATKETGQEYPQIQKWKLGYNDDKADSYYSYYDASSKGSILPDFAPDLDALVMHNRSKQTDLISSGLSIGLIISKKLKIIFEQFKFPPHRFYTAKIIHKKIELNDYYFMHVVSDYYNDYLDFLDYDQSVFVTTGISGGEPKGITLNSKQDYLNKAQQLQKDFSEKKVYRAIKAEKICFNAKFDKNLDCFIAPFGIEYYISQRLKAALFENGITGVEIQSTDRISFNSSYTDNL